MNTLENLNTWNPFDYLNTQEEINDFLIMLLQEEDTSLFIQALGHLAKKHGMSEVAEAIGVNRESLYKTFSGKVTPRWDTVIKVIKLLNLNVFKEVVS